MKKVLLLFAALALLVSCAKTIDIVDEKDKPTDPSEDPVSELTFSTYANLTRAIAEGTTVPSDNFIGLLPRFFSETSSSKFDGSNRLTQFGYDFDREVWRGLSKFKPNPVDTTGFAESTKGLFEELQKKNFPFNPFYWPGGDRVALDYVSYSYCNLLKVLISAVDRYLSPLALEGQSVTAQPIVFQVLDYLAVADPFPVNENRLDVYYQYTVLNILSVALSQAFSEGAVIDPIALGIIVALDKIVDDAKNGKPLMSMEDLDKLIMAAIPAVMKQIEQKKKEEQPEEEKVKPMKSASSGSGIPKELQELLGKSTVEAVQFVAEYVEAYRVMTGDKDKSEKDRVREIMNEAYFIFMTKLAAISKYIQDDLLYAHDRSVKNNNGPVKATYNHAKAWVKVLVNNRSNNDIFVAGVTFEDVRTGGTLVIDNSKSSPETYWDFTAERHPSHQNDYYDREDDPDDPDTGERTGISFDPYVQGGTITKAAAATKAVGSGDAASPLDEESMKMLQGLLEQMNLDLDEEDIKDIAETLFNSGLIPDTYYVPSQCYGPAKRIDSISVDDGKALKFTCLNSSNTISDVLELAENLGGVMFPAQEPGRIKISYYSWENEHQMRGTKSNITLDTLEMYSSLKYLNKKLNQEDLHEVSLNLPRNPWKMGVQYIYVINISDNELTIDAYEKEWEVKPVTPFIGPDVPGGVAPLEQGGELNPIFTQK